MSFITKTPGVCGGRACIKGTRIPVWLIAFEHRLGMNPTKLLKRHPSIDMHLVKAALHYSIDKFEEIEADIAANEGT